MSVDEHRVALANSWSAREILAHTRRLVRTHAFRLAALYLLVFAASVLGVLLFVYGTSANFVERQTEATLDAEIAGLAEQYAQRGLSGLIQIVAARSAGDRGDAMIYLVTDPDGRPLVGNIAAWPAGLPTHSASLSFALEKTIDGRVERRPARGRLFLIPGGYRLLVGRDISDAAAFRGQIRSTLIWAGLIALGIGVAGGAVMSRNLLHRVEQVNRTSERVMAGNLAVLRRFVEDRDDVALIFPVHPNPSVHGLSGALLSKHPRIHLIQPLGYRDFIHLLTHAWLIVSDSGGVQEEAPTLGKPLLIIRENTERPEAVECGVARLVGGRPDLLAKILEEVYTDRGWIEQVAKIKNPFGQGDSAKIIVQIIRELLRCTRQML